MHRAGDALGVDRHPFGGEAPGGRFVQRAVDEYVPADARRDRHAGLQHGSEHAGCLRTAVMPGRVQAQGGVTAGRVVAPSRVRQQSERADGRVGAPSTVVAECRVADSSDAAGASHREVSGIGSKKSILSSEGVEKPVSTQSDGTHRRIGGRRQSKRICIYSAHHIQFRYRSLSPDTKIATVQADQFREDLFKAKKGNGKHSFALPTPDSLKDGKSHKIEEEVKSR